MISIEPFDAQQNIKQACRSEDVFQDFETKVSLMHFLAKERKDCFFCQSTLSVKSFSARKASVIMFK